jgi:peptide/nickel transport system substrate-binding protein
VLGNSSGFDGIPAIPRHIFGDLYAAGDKTAFENSPLWSFQWIGLGPYQITRWELGTFIEGTAFDQYVLGRPKIDRVIVKYFGDERALIPGILSRDIDVIPQGGQLHIENMLTVKNQWGPTGGLALPIAKGVRTVYLQLRDPSLPWQDVRVRQALLHATDRDTLIEQLLFGLTSRADFFAPPDDQVTHLAEQRGLPKYPYDLSRAERLLAEAGWTRGSDRQFRDAAGRPLELSVTVSGDNEGEASALAGQWSADGFLSVPTPYPNIAQNASEIRHTIPGALIWPYNFSQTAMQTFTSQQVGTEANRWRGGNYGGYTAPAYEDLYRKLVNTFDTGQRVDLGLQLVQVLDEQLPALPLYFSTNGLLARAGVTGAGATSPMQAGNTWNISTWDISN